MLQGQTTWKECSLTLSKTLKFVSLSCLLWRLSIPFFSTKGKYKACSFAWVVELSPSLLWSWNNAVAATYFSPFLPFLANFEAFFVPLTHSYIDVLWASIRGSVSRNLSVSNPVYVVSNLWYNNKYFWSYISGSKAANNESEVTN